MSVKTTSERFGIQRLHAAHGVMRKLRRDGNVPSIHGNRHWPSADLLMDFLLEHPLREGGTVLDAGCGWGLGGIFCAKQFGSRVTALDADPAVFPYLEAHAELNGVKLTCQQGKFQQVTKEELTGIDTLIAADVCFWAELVKHVDTLIDHAVDAGVKRIVIADPERTTFFKLAERCMKKHPAELIARRSDRYPQVTGTILWIENH